LKVIKGRLEGDPAEPEPEPPAQLFDVGESARARRRERVLVSVPAEPEMSSPSADTADVEPVTAAASGAQPRRSRPSQTGAGQKKQQVDRRHENNGGAAEVVAPTGPAAAPAEPAPRPARAPRAAIRALESQVGQAVQMASGEDVGQAPRQSAAGKRASAPAAAKKPRQGRPKRAATIETGASLTGGELASASALAVEDIDELEAYGLIKGKIVGGVRCYDEDALVTARLAAKFARHGIEPRHLRIFLHAADRQAGLYEQVVTTLLRQRNPESRVKAADALEELSGLGASLQKALLAAMLRDLTG
jgi:hypothetical protein